MSSEIPEGYVVGNGHVYTIHFAPDQERPTDEKIAERLSSLSAIKVKHISEGGKNVAVKPTINTKENA